MPQGLMEPDGHAAYVLRAAREEPVGSGLAYRYRPLPWLVPGPVEGALAFCRPSRMVRAELYWAPRWRKHRRPENEVMFCRPL
jgi:hypothetical protein